MKFTKMKAMTFHFSEDTEMASMEFEYLDIAAVLLERI
jgi:hypothetical protein